MALPPRFLQPAIDGLRALAKNGLRYPIPVYGIQNDARAGMGASYSPARRPKTKASLFGPQPRNSSASSTSRTKLATRSRHRRGRDCALMDD